MPNVLFDNWIISRVSVIGIFSQLRTYWLTILSRDCLTQLMSISAIVTFQLNFFFGWSSRLCILLIMSFVSNNESYLCWLFVILLSKCLPRYVKYSSCFIGGISSFLTNNFDLNYFEPVPDFFILKKWHLSALIINNCISPWAPSTKQI